MVHRYKQNGLNIVVDVYSGSIHLVDDVAYEIIGLYESENKDTIVDIMKEKFLGE